MEVLRTGPAGAPGTHAGGSEPLLAGRPGGMTSFLPVSATETLLFQPLGRHDAMPSLKVSCLCLGRSCPPGQRGLPSPSCPREPPVGVTGTPLLGLLHCGSSLEFRGCRGRRSAPTGSWPPSLHCEHPDKDFPAAHLVHPAGAGLKVNVAGKIDTQVPVLAETET